MKKLFVLILALILAFSFAGCSLRQADPPEEAETTAAQTVPTVTVLFKEGETVSEYAKLLEDNGVCSAEGFMQACKTVPQGYDFLEGITDPQERPFALEGYLFPDTYEFYYDMQPEDVVKVFLDNFAVKVDEDRLNSVQYSGYTLDEILALASIIQEEATTEEMRRVSSVLHNRLDVPGQKLQCDVTVFYLNDSVEPYVDDISAYKDTYNCYNCEGLPKGPITNPGIDAIDAALDPEDTDYFFFLTDEDGGFHYAVTWAEHEENVRKYIP